MLSHRIGGYQGEFSTHDHQYRKHHQGSCHNSQSTDTNFSKLTFIYSDLRLESWGPYKTFPTMRHWLFDSTTLAFYRKLEGAYSIINILHYLRKEMCGGFRFAMPILFFLSFAFISALTSWARMQNSHTCIYALASIRHMWGNGLSN